MVEKKKGRGRQGAERYKVKDWHKGKEGEAWGMRAAGAAQRRIKSLEGSTKFHRRIFQVEDCVNSKPACSRSPQAKGTHLPRKCLLDLLELLLELDHGPVLELLQGVRGLCVRLGI